MDIQDEEIDGTTVVTPNGRLDANASTAFADRVGALVGAAKPKLLIDFSGIDFVSSAGLRALLVLLKKVQAAGGAFALCGVRAPVREVLDISGFTSMMSIHPARAEAIAALRG
jgi:anti-anti-sigma factor